MYAYILYVYWFSIDVHWKWNAINKCDDYDIMNINVCTYEFYNDNIYKFKHNNLSFVISKYIIFVYKIK